MNARLGAWLVVAGLAASASFVYALAVPSFDAFSLWRVLLPGFIFLGIAIGAVGMAVIVAVLPGLSPALMAVLFGSLSLAAWLGLRRIFRARDGTARIIHDDINK